METGGEGGERRDRRWRVGDRGWREEGQRVIDLTRFNKIAISNNKFQMASGQGSHWLIESPTIFSSMCSPPLSDICQFYF